jgi:hypothetical protein
MKLRTVVNIMILFRFIFQGNYFVMILRCKDYVL